MRAADTAAIHAIAFPRTDALNHHDPLGVQLALGQAVLQLMLRDNAVVRSIAILRRRVLGSPGSHDHDAMLDECLLLVMGNRCHKVADKAVDTAN